MTYIWINPVTEHMYQASALESFLERHGLTRVRCRRDWGSGRAGEVPKPGEGDRGDGGGCPLPHGL